MTHTAKHTPGPWVTDNYFDITSLRGDVIVRPPLSALEKARMHPGERQANAHLIAAAPAMYAWIARVCKDGLSFEDIKEGRALLSQAEGVDRA